MRVSGPVRLESVGAGPPVLDAGKELHLDPDLGRPFRVLAGGVHQVLVFSTGSMAPIGGGRLLVLRFHFDAAAPHAGEPAVFELVRRESTFAPVAADVALWSEDLGGPVVVWPEVAP